MTDEQAEALARFINDHDPRFRAKAEGAAVRCYARVENGGSGEDAARYEHVGHYAEEAREGAAADPASTFAGKLEGWLAEHGGGDNDGRPA